MSIVIFGVALINYLIGFRASTTEFILWASCCRLPFVVRGFFRLELLALHDLLLTWQYNVVLARLREEDEEADQVACRCSVLLEDEVGYGSDSN